MSETETNPEYHISSGGGIAATHAKESNDDIRVAPTTSDEYNTLRTSFMPRACWRMDDLRFAFDSSLVLPDAAEEFTDLAILVKAHPDAPLTVFGHCDPVGQDAYNKKLSGRRAVAVYAVLIRDATLWETLYATPLGGDKWGVRSLQLMLVKLGYGPVGVDGKHDDPTRQALQRFQAVAGIPESGEADQMTREKLFLAYMDSICKDEDKNPFRLEKTDFLGRGEDSGGKADYQGCSEFNPRLVFSRSENNRFANAPDKTERNRENAPNRRVLIYIFQPGLKISLDRWPCPKASEGATGCIKRFWSDHQRRRSFGDERREYEKTQDTFACRFYDRLASQSPCERGEIVAMECNPTLFTIEQPSASNYVRMHSLQTYVIHFVEGSSDIDRVQRYVLKEGKLHDPANNQQLVMECDREAYLYFSHRDDLLSMDHAKFFAQDKSGLPLLGPFAIPRGPDARLELNIWDQNDWVIVRGPLIDGARLDEVKMCEWQEGYDIGRLLPFADGSGIGFFPHGDQRQKDVQEKWKGGQPISLVHLGNPENDPMWAGTVSALPSDKAKLLLVHDAPSGKLNVGSYNEIVPTGSNQDLPGHHCYNATLVAKLLALPSSDQPGPVVDMLPAPPARSLLPGDACWQDQGQTNHCGPYTFSTAMNYWMPYTNNPMRKDGSLYAKPGNVDDTINGARTPADIVNAANKFGMHGRDNDAEELSKSRALKLLKLWINAGVPVAVLVEESYNVWSLHWKCVVGYDGNRIFMNNSGADHEVIRARRQPGIIYEKAPVGNDVDSPDAHYNKWKAAGGDVVDLITSVDECTFIPLFPKDTIFAGDTKL